MGLYGAAGVVSPMKGEKFSLKRKVKRVEEDIEEF